MAELSKRLRELSEKHLSTDNAQLSMALLEAASMLELQEEELSWFRLIASSVEPIRDLGDELEGVVADVKHTGFDATCLKTIIRVRDALRVAAEDDSSRTSYSQEKAAQTAERFAYMMECGGGEVKPGERLRQVAHVIRSLHPED